jgi:translation initiation factor IF-2
LPDIQLCPFLEICLAKATKGIRVNQLAKELGIPSKSILERLKAEGLGDQAPNHMSLISLGLAASVREWFAGGGGGVATAVETATEAAVEVAPPKAKTARGKRKAGDLPSSDDDSPTDTIEAPPAEEIAPPEPTEVEAPQPQPAPEPLIIEEPPAPPKPPVVIQAPSPAAPIAPPPPAAPPAAVPLAPAATAPAPAAPTKAPPGGPRGPGNLVPEPRPMRPTISINDRGRAAPPAERKPTPPPAPPHVPAPATIQGPRVVREEAPERVAAPRKRPGPSEPAMPPSFVQARAQGGRGVKPSDDEAEDIEKKKAGGKGRTLSSRRRGPDGRRGEAMEKLKEYSEADLEERRIRLGNAAGYRTGFDSHLKRAERTHHTQAKSIVQRGEPVEIEEPITVKTLAIALGVKSNEVISKLMKQGVMANVNQTLDNTMAETLALEYGIELQVVTPATLEEELEQELAQPNTGENLVPRPPVVTILGHVDHGKTSLLDRIRKANVAAGEAGGITQHTAAWMVDLDGKRVTFIDTPGHQAFTSMRARGANMTDVVVLVVSAAEGVQPQTIESINHARAAEVPIVVAMNKIDRPDINEQQVLGQLAANGLNPVEWGGDTEVIRTSATTGKGIPELIEILHYQSELLELKTDPTLSANGVVVESRMDEGLGAVATVLVQDGTLRVGDIILCGSGYGRLRSILNDRGEMIKEATAAMPVIVSGLNALPEAGSRFYVLDDLDRARAIAEERQVQSRQVQLASQNRVTRENLFESMSATDVKTINLIIKADVQGSIETLVKAVTESNTDEVKVKVVHSGVGGISESDVELAMATKAKPTDNRVAIIGFHVVPDDAARILAEQNHIDVKLYRVIYEILDDLKKSLSGMLEPEVREKLHGHAEIRQVFKVSRVGNIAGCMVTDGHIQRGSKIRLIRNAVVIVEDLSLESLKRVKDDVKEVKSGFECGLKIAGYDDIKVGDRLEAYIREKHERTL